MKTKLIGLVAILAFVLTLTVMAGGRVAMLTEVRGAVQLTKSGKTATAKTLAVLEGGESLVIPAKGKVTLVFFKNGQRAQVMGPARLSVSSAGKLKSDPASSMKLAKAPGKVAMTPGGFNLKKMAGVKGRPPKKVAFPNNQTFFSMPSLYWWSTEKSGRFKVMVYQGQDIDRDEDEPVWTKNLKAQGKKVGGKATLYELAYAGDALEQGTTYTLVVQAGGQTQMGTFTLLNPEDEEALKEAAAYHLDGKADVTSHVLMAALYENHSLLGRAWQELHAATTLNPDDQGLRERLQVITSYVRGEDG